MCVRDSLISDIVGVMVRGLINFRISLIRFRFFIIIWVIDVRIRLFWI